MKLVRKLLMDGQGVAARMQLLRLLAKDEQQPEPAEVVAALQEALEALRVETVEAFCKEMDLDLPTPFVDAIEAAIVPQLERLRHWRGILKGVTRERLAREARSAVVTRDIKLAARHGAKLIELAPDGEERVQAARQFAYALAGLGREQERVLEVIRQVGKHGGAAAEGAHHVAERYAFLMRNGGPQRQFETGDQEWRQQLTEAVLSLRPSLPGPGEVGEPDREVVRKFEHECGAIARAGLVDGQIDHFIDALMILVEFCPTDPSRVPSPTGVEERMFTKLGPMARLVAVRALGLLADQVLVRKAVMELARLPESQGRMPLLAGIMGGLRHGEFFPYLQAMLERAQSEREGETIVDALGRLSDPAAADLLLRHLALALKRSNEPANERRALTILTAIGRLARTRGVEPGRRNEIVRRTIELAEPAGRGFTGAAAHELFSVRLDELEQELKDWAARQLVTALWGLPPAHVKADTAAHGGWRDPLIATLKRLGKPVLPAVLEEAQRHAATYSGAMGALAEVLDAIGDHRAVPTLDMMARVAITWHDDGSRTQLMAEKVKDAATDQLLSLDRDALVNTILYAMLTVGGESGRNAVLELADEVQAGRLRTPGRQTTQILVDTKLKYGRMERIGRPAADVPQVDEDELRHALSAAEGGLLTKKVTQISAIAKLGQWRRVEGIPVLVGLLGSKDSMIATSAHTALAAFLHPLPAESDFEAFVMNFLEEAGVSRDRTLERILDFIRREMPKRNPYGRLFGRQVEICVEDEELAHRLKGAMLEADESSTEPAAEEVRPNEREIGTPSSIAEPGGSLGSTDLKMTELDRRRAEFRARKQQREMRRPGAEG